MPSDKWLSSFVAGFKEALDRTKRVELAGLGAMRATAQNDYFFVASEDIDIYPEGMGLEPVTIKSSTLMDYGLELKDDSEPGPQTEAETVIDLDTETTAEEPEDIPEPEVELVSEPETEPESEPQPAIELESEQDIPERAESKTTPEVHAKKRCRVRWWAVLLIVLAVILLFLILSVIFKDQLPWGDAVDNIINHILYTEEELRILNS